MKYLITAMWSQQICCKKNYLFSPQEIDWNNWKENIHTEKLVDNLKEKFQSLATQEYNVEAICHNVVSSHSQDLEQIVNK